MSTFNFSYFPGNMYAFSGIMVYAYLVYYSLYCIAGFPPMVVCYIELKNYLSGNFGLCYHTLEQEVAELTVAHLLLGKLVLYNRVRGQLLTGRTHAKILRTYLGSLMTAPLPGSPQIAHFHCLETHPQVLIDDNAWLLGLGLPFLEVDVCLKTNPFVY